MTGNGIYDLAPQPFAITVRYCPSGHEYLITNTPGYEEGFENGIQTLTFRERVLEVFDEKQVPEARRLLADFAKNVTAAGHSVVVQNQDSVIVNLVA